MEHLDFSEHTTRIYRQLTKRADVDADLALVDELACAIDAMHDSTRAQFAETLLATTRHVRRAHEHINVNLDKRCAEAVLNIRDACVRYGNDTVDSVPDLLELAGMNVGIPCQYYASIPNLIICRNGTRKYLASSKNVTNAEMRYERSNMSSFSKRVHISHFHAFIFLYLLYPPYH
jgi:hypothetical protein